MSEKKRTTVTTIETHEVWIIRSTAPDRSEIEVPKRELIAAPQQIPSLSELHDLMETNESSTDEES